MNIDTRLPSAIQYNRRIGSYSNHGSMEKRGQGTSSVAAKKQMILGLQPKERLLFIHRTVLAVQDMKKSVATMYQHLLLSMMLPGLAAQVTLMLEKSILVMWIWVDRSLDHSLQWESR